MPYASKKVAFHTLGCRLNQAETTVIRQSLKQQGYDVVNADEAADILILNTCTVTSQSDAKGRQAIRAFHRKHPESMIAVIGCYAQMEPQAIRELEGVKLVVGSEEKLQIANYLEEAAQSDEPLVVHSKISKTTFQAPAFQWEQNTTRAYLKIQDGCDFMCSFCIIPFARGRSRYREFPNLLEEAQTLVRGGAKEIVITGVNVGTYQHDHRGIVNIVDALDALPELERIRVSSIEPTTVPPALIERMANPSHKLVPFLHLPLQSGSDPILQQMKRRYLREDYRKEVMEAYERVPNLCIGTDVMVGFPGESDDDFEATFSLLNELPIAFFHVFPFSERKGTPAVRMPDPVNPQEKQRRGQVLRELSQHKRYAFQEAFIGSTQTVLFERNKNNGIATGYTENYIRVQLTEPQQHSLQNQLLPVKLIENQGELMMGQKTT